MFVFTFCCQCWSCVFFFKQKTAYELRISDWSSDVCSSDLVHVSEAQGFEIIGDAIIFGDDCNVGRKLAYRIDQKLSVDENLITTVIHRREEAGRRGIASSSVGNHPGNGPGTIAGTGFVRDFASIIHQS